ncbi:MAG TPA: proton-conducting transporter membrane subunit, partial [Acidimicrobiia bacterium]|nr:proton-conducting transporter membrane subunit [Acidimicrobiia bacterium]
QRVIALVAMFAVSGTNIALLVDVDRRGVRASQVGGWPAPFGITLVVDLFSALMLVMASFAILAVLVYAIGQRDVDRASRSFHPVYLVLAAGVSASFLAGDLFYLFVAFEMTLIASYVLITLGGGADQVRTGMTYVVMNLLGSTIFLATIGLVYAATGTVNIADLVDKVAALPDGVALVLGLFLLVAFGVKAAIFPLFSWLPDSYPTALTPITAIFAGLLTKVGVYAIVRTQTFLFAPDGASKLLLVIAALTMVVGVLGAIAQNDMKRILSFHIISQIGYMIMGLALFTVSGLAGAVFFMVHQIPVKTSLFLVGGIVERSTGTAGLDRLEGLVRRMPFVSVLFFLAALSLAGVPPFSGFVAKLALVEAGFDGSQWAIVAVSLVVSLLTLFSMIKIWNGAFWGAARLDGVNVPFRRPTPVPTAAAAALVGLALFVAVAARPLYGLAERAAFGLLDQRAYVAEVLRP